MSYQPRISQKLKSLFWIVLVGGILVLSWFGLSEMYPETNQLRYMPDRVFRLIKIVTGNDPVSPVEPNNVPLSLIIVKILVSILLLRALFKIVQSVFFEQYTQLKTSFQRRHLVVVGIGNKGARILKDYHRRTGKKAVAIEKNPEHSAIEDMRRAGYAVVIGDATQSHTLKNANVKQAKTVICFIKNEQTGVQIASQLSKLTAVTRPQAMPPLQCFVHLDNPRLVSIFQRFNSDDEPTTQSRQARQLDIHFFNLYLMVARRFFNQLPQDLATVLQLPNVHIRLLMWGFDEMAQTLLVQGLRIFHLLPTQSSEWLIFCNNASQQQQLFRQKFPKLDHIIANTSIKNVAFIQDNADIAQLLSSYLCSNTSSSAANNGSDSSQTMMSDQHYNLQKNTANALIYNVAICATKQDKINLANAVELLHHSCEGYPPQDFPIYVLNSESHDMDTLLSGQARKRLHFFGDFDDFCKYELITTEKQDSLAKAIHEDYLRQTQALSTQVLSESDRYKSQWQNLNEDAKDANRTQADHIIYKLILTHKLGDLRTQQPIRFDPVEVENLAITEHARWVTHRYLRGWEFAPTRDDTQKHHPSLVAWDSLNDSERQKDRDTILRIPTILQALDDIDL